MPLALLLTLLLLGAAVVPFPSFWFATTLVVPLQIFMLLFAIGVYAAAKDVVKRDSFAITALGGLFAIPLVLSAGLHVNIGGEDAAFGALSGSGNLALYGTRLILGILMLALARVVGEIVSRHCPDIKQARMWTVALYVSGIIMHLVFVRSLGF
jgi:hypothetical protein